MAKEKICSLCGTIGQPKLFTKGSFLIELFLWLCFIFPGVLYSLWRVSSKVGVCRKCGSQNLLPLDSPMGQEIAAKSKAYNKN